MRGSLLHSRPVEVRFRDIDAMGVAHHTVPLVYFEQARAEWWAGLVGDAGLAGIDYILAEVRVKYHAPIRWPATLVAGLRVGRIGGRSFDLEYELTDEAGNLFVSGATVQVMYDYEAGCPKAIPEHVREALESSLNG